MPVARVHPVCAGSRSIFGKLLLVSLTLLSLTAQSDAKDGFVGCSLSDFSRLQTPAGPGGKPVGGNNKPGGKPGAFGEAQVPFTFLKRLPGVNENLSGVTFFPKNGTLIAIRNKPPALFEVSQDGRVLRTITLKGFDDTEGTTYMEGSKFAFTEETKSNIVIVDLGRAGNALTPSDAIQTIKVKLPMPVKHNKGLEGVAYDDRAKVFYAVQEKQPTQVLKVFMNGTSVPIWNQKIYSKTMVNIAKIKCASQMMFRPGQMAQMAGLINGKLPGKPLLGKDGKPILGKNGKPVMDPKDQQNKQRLAGAMRLANDQKAHRMRQCISKNMHLWKVP
eukprot:CAMPEP_0173397240 /NCGR_PEP_ID=MMETSP1356-20130122/37796_1 /TAXON_ID=77927 ORGANISM="Hemiselmis virescens, Strain PCC157" /NCGR_SAMPLE_ID=MMETSP1356 /ASSEMBLY_ACC=CAM_ASM_000847 /LENGTH=331 /DNA_ID=CAMNT_0014356455 /DNA_START=74 /DNA_END=1066 /DNA_ORIENTATION=-